LVEEVLVEPGVGVEDFEADEAVVLPVEDDEATDTGWELGRDGVAVVGDPHGSTARVARPLPSSPRPSMSSDGVDPHIM
jgi:hypothetical protein